MSDNPHQVERDYYRTVLQVQWGSMSPRNRRKIERIDNLLVLAIEGFLKYDRR